MVFIDDLVKYSEYLQDKNFIGKCTEQDLKNLKIEDFDKRLIVGKYELCSLKYTNEKDEVKEYFISKNNETGEEKRFNDFLKEKNDVVCYDIVNERYRIFRLNEEEEKEAENCFAFHLFEVAEYKLTYHEEIKTASECKREQKEHLEKEAKRKEKEKKETIGEEGAFYIESNLFQSWRNVKTLNEEFIKETLSLINPIGNYSFKKTKGNVKANFDENLELTFENQKTFLIATNNTTGDEKVINTQEFVDYLEKNLMPNLVKESANNENLIPATEEYIYKYMQEPDIIDTVYLDKIKEEKENLKEDSSFSL